MAQKLFATGLGVFRRAERKETIDDLDHTSCNNLFHSAVMVLGKNEYLQQSRREESIVNVSESVSGVTNRPAK